MQFLNQKVQALADFAALGQQAVYLVEMRGQAGDLFSHIDANGKCGGFCQRPVLSSLGQGGVVGQRHGFLPALHETLFLLLDQLGHQRPGLLGQGAQLRCAICEHGRQPCTLTLARLQQLFDGLFGQLEQVVAKIVRFSVFIDRDAQNIGHAQAGCLGHPGFDGVFKRTQALQRLRRRCPQTAGVAAFQPNAHFHFAALELRGQEFAQNRFGLPQFVGQAKGEVQETAVDRADFNAQPRTGLARTLGAGGGFGSAGLRGGVARHAED